MPEDRGTGEEAEPESTLCTSTFGRQALRYGTMLQPMTETEAPMFAGSRSHTRRMSSLVGIVALGVAIFVSGAPLALAGQQTCFGITATISGDEGSNQLRGTSGRDVIVGLGGNDIILTGGGNDLVCGKGGRDVIRGGPGDDLLSGNRGRDRIIGVGGDDLIRGGRRNDRLNVGRKESGNDHVIGGKGDDVLRAGRGRDRLFGNHGDDLLAEGRRDNRRDLLSGGLDTDTCRAGAEDRLRNCEIRS
jgi:Ca2+-binding RTX toxin-like protein